MTTAVSAGFSTALIRHDQANNASGAIAQKLGFQFVRSEAHAIDAPGQTGTTLVWALNADVAEVSR